MSKPNAEGKIVVYTVIRFTSGKTRTAAAEEVGKVLNEQLPGAYTGIRRAGDGFSVVIGTAESWSECENGVRDFIARSSRSIEYARKKNLDVSADVAVGKEDYSGKVMLCLVPSREFIKLLHENDVRLEFTIY